MNIILKKESLAEVKNWFSEYVNAFKFTDPELQRNIDIKREHTERVVIEILNIGKSLGLNNYEQNLAEVIAMFHDIGRFEQFKIYKTFSDLKSENHAELGIKILKQYNVLNIFDKEIQNIVFCSIRYHNRPSLPEEENETCLLYSKLIRDADKLDILKVVTDYYSRFNGQKNVALVLELPDNPGISEEVYAALMKRQPVEMKHVKNINDIKLLQVGWIYDINFSPTFDFIRKRRYLEKLREALPDSKEVKEIFEIIQKLQGY